MLIGVSIHLLGMWLRRCLLRTRFSILMVWATTAPLITVKKGGQSFRLFLDNLLSLSLTSLSGAKLRDWHGSHNVDGLPYEQQLPLRVNQTYLS